MRRAKIGGRTGRLAAGVGVACGILTLASLPAHAAEAKRVSAGGSHNCAVRASGKVRCWGRDVAGQATPRGGRYRSVSAGGGHTCGVKRNGKVRCWGYNGDGQTDVPAGLQ